MKRAALCFTLILLLNFVGAENLNQQRVELEPRSFHKNIERDESQQLNPRSFYYNKHTQQENTPNVDKEPDKKLELTGNEITTMEQPPRKNDVKEKEMYQLHYYRLLNMLLKNMYIENDESGFIEGTIGIQASLEELEILQNIESQNIPLKEIDEILSRVLHQPRQSLYVKTLISLSFISHFVYTHQYIIYVIVAFITAVFVMMKFCTTRSTAITFIFLCILSSSWYITHDDMIKEVMIKRKIDEMVHKEMPSSCKPQAMRPWYERIWLLNVAFSQSSIDDCEKYVQANLVTPLTEVTLLMSFSRMLSRFIFEPLLVYGKILNIFIANLTSGMNMFEKQIVRMTIYFGHFFIIFLILVIFFGSFSILTPIGLIRLGGNPRMNAVAPERIQALERDNVPLAEPSRRIEHSKKTKKAVKQPSPPKIDMSSKEEENEEEEEEEEEKDEMYSDLDEAGPSNAKKRDSPAKCKKIGLKTKSLNNRDYEKKVASENINTDSID